MIKNDHKKCQANHQPVSGHRRIPDWMCLRLNLEIRAASPGEIRTFGTHHESVEFPPAVAGYSIPLDTMHPGRSYTNPWITLVLLILKRLKRIGSCSTSPCNDYKLIQMIAMTIRNASEYNNDNMTPMIIALVFETIMT